MSAIEWTDTTWNPVAGCTRASRGCDNCYAVKMTNRLGAMADADAAAGRDAGRKDAYRGLTVLNNRGDRHFNGTVRTISEALSIPLRWRKPRRVFVNSMSDLFHPDVPFEFIDQVFAVMALCPKHTFQVLTKRPERMAEYLNDAGRSWRLREVADGQIDAIRFQEHVSDPGWRWPLPNVWLGTSCEDQPAADERIPHLRRCPAAVRFLSCEPLLSEIDLSAWFVPVAGRDIDINGEAWRGGNQWDRLHWVIVGGESGPGARPCNVDWIRSIVQQCKGAEVPVFCKQLGARPLGFMGWADWCRRPAAEMGRRHWQLKDDQGRTRAEVWGGTWFTWDEEGVGGENDVERNEDDALARRNAVNALKRQQWNRCRLASAKGSDPDEWPDDLRVREFPGVAE